MSGSNSKAAGGRPERGRDGALGPILACGVLILMLGFQLLLPLDQPTPAPAGLAARRAPPVSIPIEPDWPRILAAPVFAPDRKPAPGGSQLPGGGALAGYAVVGAATGGATASAVVTTPGGQTRVLRLGDEIDGWRVVGLGGGRVRFDKKGVRHELVVGAPAESGAQAAQTPAPSEGEP